MTASELVGVELRQEGGDWIKLLPAPWSTDPTVVMFLASDTALSQVLTTVDGRITVEMIVEEDGTKKALRILEDVGGYLQQILTLRKMGMTPVPPEYVGPLSDLPQSQLLVDGQCPLILLHAAPHGQNLNLKRYLRRTNPVFCGFHSQREKE